MSPRPILVVAVPRSGSSWFGERLGSSPTAVYRREPITQLMLGRGEDPFAYVGIDDLTDVHRSEILTAFSPVESLRLVVKEVTPLRTSLYRALVDPLLVLLVRHPVAVAVSQTKRGWEYHDGLLGRFGPQDEDLAKALRGLWSDADQISRKVAYTAASWVAAQRAAPNALVVAYETLVADAVAIATVADDLGLASLPETATLNSETIDAESIDNGAPYATKRSAGFDAQAWRSEVSASDLDRLFSIYSQFGFDAYPSGDW